MMAQRRQRSSRRTTLWALTAFLITRGNSAAAFSTARPPEPPLAKTSTPPSRSSPTSHPVAHRPLSASAVAPFTASIVTRSTAQRGPWRGSFATRLHASAAAAAPAAAATANVLVETLRTFARSSPPSWPSVAADAAIKAPPLAYFCALLAAGVGVPVSEDALCIFAGTILPSLSSAADPSRQFRLVIALYLGVVISDAVTFSLGRLLRFGVLEPVRKRLGVGGSEGPEVTKTKEEGEDTDGGVQSEVESHMIGTTGIDGLEVDRTKMRLRKRDKIRSKLESAGDYAGFVVRFSVGMRGPLMLLAGFTGRAPFAKFILGSAVGALGTLSMQLAVGYGLRNNRAAVAAALAGMSTMAVAGPLFVAIVSWFAAIGWNGSRKRKEPTSSAALP